MSKIIDILVGLSIPIGLILLFLSFVPAHSAIYRNIAPSHGGYVGVFYITVKQSIKKGETPRITGRCDSACTLWLMHPRVCVGPRAALGFHAASNAGGTRLLRQSYPANINRWINAQGGLTRKLIVLKGPTLFKYVRRCS